MIRWGLALSMLVTASFAASPVHADEAAVAQGGGATQLGDDGLTLKDGSTVRGTVIEEVPGERVVIAVFGDDKPRTLPWADIADVERGKYAASGEAAGATGSTGSTDAPEKVADGSEPGVVHLHIETDEPVTLFRIAGGAVAQVGQYTAISTYYEPVCKSPCDRVVDGSSGETFVVSGDGVPGSEAFELAGWSGDTTLDVDPGNTGLLAGGSIALTLGITGVVMGAVFLPMGLALDDPDTGIGDTFALIGGISLGAGAGLVGISIPMLIAGGTDAELRRSESPRQTATSKPEPVPAKWYLGQF